MSLAHSPKELAKKLTRLTLGADGQIDPARADAVLKALEPYKPRHRQAILKAYLHYLQIEDRRSRLAVEHAGDLGPAELESLRAQYSKKYGRTLRLEARTNPALLAGLRLSVGDDIYEASAAGRLAALATALS